MVVFRGALIRLNELYVLFNINIKDLDVWIWYRLFVAYIFNYCIFIKPQFCKIVSILSQSNHKSWEIFRKKYIILPKRAYKWRRYTLHILINLISSDARLTSRAPNCSWKFSAVARSESGELSTFSAPDHFINDQWSRRWGYTWSRTSPSMPWPHRICEKWEHEISEQIYKASGDVHCKAFGVL